MDGQEQIKNWRKAVNEYKGTYAGLYNGKQPHEDRVMSFCLINKIPWPLPKMDESDEVEYYVPPHVDLIFGGENEG